MKDILHLIGKNFGFLKIIEDSGIIDGRRHVLAKCQRCKANTKSYNLNSLKSGLIKSCGCLKRDENPNFIDGRTKTKIYTAYTNMLSRCYNPRQKQYKDYGGRGIKVCDRWLGHNGFVNFRADMKDGHRDGLQLNRIDNNGDYNPKNCNWITQKENVRNKRSNHYITFNGQTKTLVEWSEITGINYGTLKSRLNDSMWSVEKSLTTPVK